MPTESSKLCHLRPHGCLPVGRREPEAFLSRACLVDGCGGDSGHGSRGDVALGLKLEHALESLEGLGKHGFLGPTWVGQGRV